MDVLANVKDLRGINFGVSETRFEAVWEKFGGKTVVYLEPVALRLAEKSGRPVKMTYTRPEMFEHHRGRHKQYMDMKIGIHCQNFQGLLTRMPIKNRTKSLLT